MFLILINLAENNMPKLTKMQRKVLVDALEVFDKHGKNLKPITCNTQWRDNIDEFTTSFAAYSKQMFKLLDAGVIEQRDDDGPSFAHINIDHTRQVLAVGTY